MFVGTLTDSKDAWPTLIYSAILLLIVWFMKPIVRAWWMVRNIPGPPTFPFIGNFNTWFVPNQEQVYDKSIELHKTYGPIVRIPLFHTNFIMINNPEDAKILMMNPKLRNRGPIFEILSNVHLQNSMVLLKDDEWSARRKLINNAFQLKNVVTYLDTFAKLGEELCDRLVDVADGRTIVDIRDHINICTLNGILQTAIGYKSIVDNQNGVIFELEKKMQRILDLALARSCNPLYWVSRIYDLTVNGKAAKQEMKWIHELLDHHIALSYKNAANSDDEENDTTTPGGKRLRCLSEIVIEESIKEGKTIPASHVRSDVLLLCFGSQSCANVMSYLVMLIGMHSEYQERIFEEQRAVFGDSLRTAQNEDITKMPLLEMVIKETLRMFPPFPTLSRHLAFDVTISNRHIIPADTYTFIDIFNIHHDHQNYVDPEKFWPERWLPENSVGRHPCAYLPYGVGVRNCIAIKYAQFQMKATISRMLRQFSFTNDYTMKDLRKIGIGPYVKSLTGHKVRITQR